MRKIFATLLAVIMLVGVCAAIPVSAASSTPADVPDLLATEIVPHSTTTADPATAKVTAVFDYIELYNRGETPVDIYTLAVARAPYYTQRPTNQSHNYYSTWNMWRGERKFQSKMDINTGAVTFPADRESLVSATTSIGVEWNNPVAGSVAPHSFAILWFLSDDTLRFVSESDTEGHPDLPREMFRERYEMADDVPIFYLWANSAIDNSNPSAVTIKTNEFELPGCRNNYEGYMLGLVDKSFGLDEKVYESNTFNDKVKVLFAYGATQEMHNPNNNGLCYPYVPADQVPEVPNRKTGKNIEDGPDYVVGGYVESYRQVGIPHGSEEPTAGGMPAYQWYYVDAENAPDSVKNGDPDWGPKAVSAWANRYYPDASQEEGEGFGRDEPDIEVNPPTREDLERKFFGDGKIGNKPNTANAGKEDDATKSEGLPTGALIGIIAGGVVLVAAAVVAVLIIIKNKKAAPAVENVEEVPTEEMPEVPTDEENKDE